MSTKVLYDGQTFLELTCGQIATIGCTDKRLSTDLEILFSEDGTITYDGTEIEANIGQRVIFHCADKKMKSDIVIHIPYTDYQTLVTADGRVYTTSEEFIFKVLES